MEQFVTSPAWQQSVTEHFYTESKNHLYYEQWQRLSGCCDVSVLLAPWYKCQDLLPTSNTL